MGGEGACSEGSGSGEEAAAVLAEALDEVLGGDFGGGDVGVAERHEVQFPSSCGRRRALSLLLYFY